MVTLCQKKLALFGVTMTYQGTGGRRKNIKIISGIQTKYELLNLLWTISDHLLHCLKDSGLGDIYDCWILILFNISMYPVSILVIFLIICVFVSLHLMNLFLYRVFGNEGYTESGSNLIDFYPEIL